MTRRYFFGYGSLVNRGTHDYAGAFGARLSGWRRAWRATPERARCYLTAIAVPGSEIWGLVTPVPEATQAELDRRERAYARVRVSDALRHDAPVRPEVELYAIPAGRQLAPTGQNPILLSYLDVVVQGYLREFGQDGVRHFFDTTDGWQAPVLDDRAAPIYPRAQALSAAERRLVDRGLVTQKARLIGPG